MPSIDLHSLWARQRAVVMGIVNVTPDSFADGGRHADSASAVAFALCLADEGADIIDIGGESTRPGAATISPAEEISRVVPVVAELARLRPDVAISVDTSKPEVAEAALDAGATIVNDVSAGAAAGMLALVARKEAAVVLMHMRGTPASMQGDTGYADVVAEVHEYLNRRATAAHDAGIAAERIWLDPGIGFGKDPRGNLRLLGALPELAAMGHPVVVGASRKSFVGALTGAAVADRLPGSLAALTTAVGLPRVVVRVHDVAATVQFLAVCTALEQVP